MRLGIMYAIGQGKLRRDEDEAAKWICKSAELGSSQGQFVLGLRIPKELGYPKTMGRRDMHIEGFGAQQTRPRQWIY